jgi:hypothetical protein
MHLPESLKNPSPKALRQFAVGWLVFFAVLSFRVFWRGNIYSGTALGAVALGGPVLGWIAPAILRHVFRAWMTLAFPIGWIVSQISLAIVFYGVITPLAFLLRLTGRDRLRRRRVPDAASYWKPKAAPASVERYFRPY